MEKKYFFDKPENVKRLLNLFYASLVILVIADFFVPKHPVFAWEEYPSFYGVYGFVACVVLVLAARFVLRKLVMKKEGYYDR
jgi:hypothetical protein